MATSNTMARTLGCFLLAATVFAAGWQARAEGLGVLAHQVRIIRYAATGNSARIEGEESPPAARQAWLNAIAAAIEQASGFFWRAYTSGTVADLAHKSHPAWVYEPIPLAVLGTGPGGVVTEGDITAEMGKVTWIVAPVEPLCYSTRHSKWAWAPYHGGIAAASIAAAIAASYPSCCEQCVESNAYYRVPDDERWYGTCRISVSRLYWDPLFQPCSFHAYGGGRAIKGQFAAPASMTVDPAPGAGGGTPPEAKVNGYYLGVHGGTAPPTGLLCGYDAMWATDCSMPSPPSWPAIACPVPPETEVQVIDSLSGTVGVGTCHAKIRPPVIPEDCPSCMARCSAPPGVTTSSCSSCGSPVFSIDRESLTVRAKDTPLWINTHNGPALGIRMSYTGDPSSSGDFGRGWTWDYAMRVTSYGNIRIVSGPSGKGGWWFIPNGDGTYDGPPSTGYTLAGNAGGGWTMATADDAHYAFASDGRLLSVTNRFGQALILAYNANNRVQSVTSADGVALTFSRDAQGRVTQISAPDGRSATFVYGKAFPEAGVTRDENYLITAIDMGGVECAYEYDWSNEIVEGVTNSGALRRIRRQIVRGGGGAIVQARDTTFAYATSAVDGLRELRVTDPASNETLYRLDTMGGETVFTEVLPSGATTTEQYELRSGRRILLARIDALENESTYTYDTSGFLLTETAPLGQVTSYTRNGAGEVLTETRPGGAVTTYIYAANGRDVLTRTDPGGAVTTYTYNTQGQVLTVTRSAAGLAPEVTTYTYGAQGRRLTETNPTGQTTTDTYNTAGRLVSVAVSGTGTTAYTYNSRGYVATTTKPDGVVITRSYDNLDRVIQETWSTDSTSIVTTYGCCGVEQRTSRIGAITNYEYDPNGRLAAEIDHFGNRTEHEYDANGNRTVVRDALNHETVTTYDLLNRPVLVTYPDGTTESTVYDALGRQVRQTDRAGRAQITVYDTAGNVTSTQLEVTIGQGTQTVTLSTSTHDAAGRVLTSTNADGLTVSYTYDAFGRQVQTTWPDQTSAATTHGLAGVLTQTDRMGSTTTYAYDSLGRLASVTAPAAALGAPQAVTAYAYDSIGRRASVTDPLGRVTSFAYDQEGRTTTVIYPGNATEATTYAAGGLVQSRTDRSGVTSTATYDAMGRVLTQSAGGAVVAATTYDALGRAATQTDARGVTVTLTYDSMGRLTRTTMPDTAHEDMTYGPNGVLTRTDRGGATTTYVYDAFGRKASETNPNSETIAYEYDAAGRMTVLIDANGSQTQWAYDNQGRLVTKTYADATTYTYTYDAGGRMLTRTDAKGVTTAYSYDALGRLLAVDYPNDPDIAYTYDLVGHRLTMTDAAGTATWTYDAVSGQPATADGPLDNDTIAYTWDPAGRRLSTALAGTTLTVYTHDSLGRIATVSTAAPPAAVFTYSYLGASTQVASLAMPGGVTTARTYDTLGRLSTVVNSGPGAAPGSTVSSFGYTLDNHDRRTQAALADGGRWEYTYDATGQLVGGVRYAPRWPDGIEQVLATYGYQYDPMGNPTQRSEDAGVSAYTYNNLNQLVTGNWSGTLSAFGWTSTAGLAGVSVDTQPAMVFQKGEWTAKGFSVPAGQHTFQVVRTAQNQTQATAQATVTRPAAATQFTHDANGNMLGEVQWLYTWDAENRLVAVTPSPPDAHTPKLTYVYDGLGRRRVKREYVWATDHWQLTTEHFFLWDSWILLSERITDHAHNPAITHTRTYVCGLDLSGQLGGEGMDPMATAGGIGGILTVASSSSAAQTTSVALFLYDGNGNVTNLVDAGTTAVLATYEYGPFGNTLVASGPLAETNPIRFSTKYAEAARLPGSAAGPDLFYYGRRYFSPGIGRWASRDPAGEAQGANLLCFVANRPLSHFDRLGLKCCCCCVTNVVPTYTEPEPRVLALDATLLGGRRGTIRAWVFRPTLGLAVTIDYAEKDIKKDGFAACQYDWWERAIEFSDELRADGRGCKDGDWCNVSQLVRDGTISNRRMGYPQEFLRPKRPDPCTSTGGTTIMDGDEMQVAHPEGQAGQDSNRIEFKIVVRSGSGCASECGKKYGSQTSWQVTGTIRFSVTGTGKTKAKWDPPLQVGPWDGNTPR
jgi:RHS repeat-associated protein